MALGHHRFLAAFTGVFTLAAAAASAQQAGIDDGDHSKGRGEAAASAVGNCVPVAGIHAMDVLDDRRIRLKMEGGPDLMMRLERECPQLRFHGFFTYEPTLGQICAAIDHIVTRAGAQCVIDGFTAYTGDGSAPAGKTGAQEPPS